MVRVFAFPGVAAYIPGHEIQPSPPPVKFCAPGVAALRLTR